MSKLTAREYFAKYKIGDLVFKNFLNAIKAGKSEVSQSLTVETILADDSWLAEIENAVFYIEQIVKKPQKFIVDEKAIVQVEKAKRITSESIRHLSINSNLVRDVDECGNVNPKKILTTFFEEDLLIYENRFVYTLILRLNIFLEQRLNFIKENVGTFDITNLTLFSEFNYNDLQVEYDLKVKLKNFSEENIKLDKTDDIIKRLEKIKQRVYVLTGSDFYKELSKTKPINPPIAKTNLLRMNVNYKACYNLWLFISSVNAFNYSVEVKDTTLNVEEDYYDDLLYLIAINIRAVLENNNAAKRLYKDPYQQQQEGNYDVVTKFVYKPDFSADMPNGEIDFLNEYYYDKIKSLLIEEIDSKIDGDKKLLTNNVDITMPFVQFYRMISKINNLIFSDLLNFNEETEDSAQSDFEKQKAKLAKQIELLRRQQLLVKLKEIDLNQAKRATINMAGNIEKTKNEIKRLEKLYKKSKT